MLKKFFSILMYNILAALKSKFSVNHIAVLVYLVVTHATAKREKQLSTYSAMFSNVQQSFKSKAYFGCWSNSIGMYSSVGSILLSGF